MIILQNIALSFSGQKVFDDVSLNLCGTEKMGVVGLNGAGKSTLLKVIAGRQQIDQGSINCAKSIRIGYLSQDILFQSETSVLDAVMSTAFYIDESEYGQVSAQAKKMLIGLGFSQSQFDKPVNNLSVGWRMRTALAQLLMQKADFYLFDEPTNHLDIVTKDWFVSFLQNASFGFMLVSHDRYFLDTICTSIFELERGNGTLYQGNYTTYVQQKEDRLEKLIAAYTLQQKEITRKQATIDRFRASATKASLAKSMQKALDRIERIEIPPSHKTVSFSLPDVEQSGKIVLTFEKIVHAFNSKQIFAEVTGAVYRQERVALVAANGVGKTTLLNLIAGKIPLQKGNITYGHNVTMQYFEQDQVNALNPYLTIIETIYQAVPKVSEQVIRTMLGCFLFSQDSVNKKINVLSGGEKNRVGMVRVLLERSNLLILDEPTNHLDIPSKELLLKALLEYKGTIVFVSHDQDFINGLATHIIELTPHGAYKYEGNYEQYRYQKEATTSLNIQSQKQEKNLAPQVTINKEHEKIVKKLERTIETLEKEIKKLSEELYSFDYGTPDFAKRYEKIADMQKKHAVLIEEWEKTA